jgi:hypothetical protein
MNRKILAPMALSAAALMLAACGGANAPVTVQSSSTPSSTGAQSASGEPTAEQSASGDGTAQVQPLPFNASGLLGGNAKPKFPDGEPGKVSVVQIGPLEKDSGTLLFAFRNNTGDGISHVDWTGTATSGGKIVATGSSQGGIPAQVQSGEVGLAYIYFDNAKSIPKDAKYEFTVETTPVDASSYNTAPIKVTQANLAGGSIVGGATNETGAEVQGPYSVLVYCFKGDKIQAQHQTFAEQDGNVAPGGKVTFSLDLFGDQCPTFTVGVGGYFS